MSSTEHPLQDFNPEHVMDDWRRLYDWAVLSRQSTALIEEVSFLGQQYSSLLNAYRQTNVPRRRTRIYQELKTVFTTMQTLYRRLNHPDRIPLHFGGGPS